MDHTALAFAGGMTIHELGERANRYIGSAWETLYDEMYAQLTEAFTEIQDAAYGLYLDRLMPHND